MARRTQSRLRWTTLVLLWAWAITVFVTLDLFFNIDEFDSVRPRAGLYRGMRVAAHKIVGEAVDGRGPEVSAPVARADPQEPVTAHELRSGLAAVEAARSGAELRALAAGARDARVRIAALRRLARDPSEEARSVLVATVRDPDETAKTRRRAAMLLGLTGPGAEAALAALVDAGLPTLVRTGAVIGLGRVGTATAVRRLLAIAADGPGQLKGAAAAALAAVTNPDATTALVEVVRNACLEPEIRAAACRALARHPGSAVTAVLGTVLADPGADTALRLGAAEALGKRRDRSALEDIESACRDARPAVARAARAACHRVSHR